MTKNVWFAALLLLGGSVAAAPPERGPLVRRDAEGVRVAAGATLADTLRELSATELSATEASAAESSAAGASATGASAGARGALWAAWQVPAVAGMRNTCCFDRNFTSAVCHLEEKNQGWGSRDGARDGGDLLVLARWAAGRVERVRSVSVTCGIDSGGVPLVRLHGVTPAQSVALLVALAEASGRREVDEPLAALAHHAAPAAFEALRRLAGPGGSSELREQSLFWIGQARGAEGASFLAGVARGDADPAIRNKAVFALSQSEAPGATETIVEVARRDRDPEVRREALFWLAQTGSPEAARVLLAALDQDPSAQVREHAVFAITQLPHGQAVPLLVRIVRERRDPRLRQQALFWLGQTDDPRALDFIEEVLAQ